MSSSLVLAEEGTLTIPCEMTAEDAKHIAFLLKVSFLISSPENMSDFFRPFFRLLAIKCSDALRSIV